MIKAILFQFEDNLLFSKTIPKTRGIIIIETKLVSLWYIR